MSLTSTIIFRYLLTVLLVSGVLPVSGGVKAGKARKHAVVRGARPAGEFDGLVPGVFLF